MKTTLAIVAGVLVASVVEIILLATAQEAIAPKYGFIVRFVASTASIAAGFAVCFRLCGGGRISILFAYAAVSATVVILWVALTEGEDLIFAPNDGSWRAYSINLAAWAAIAFYSLLQHLIIGAVVYFLYPKRKRQS